MFTYVSVTSYVLAATWPSAAAQATRAAAMIARIAMVGGGFSGVLFGVAFWLLFQKKSKKRQPIGTRNKIHRDRDYSRVLLTKPQCTTFNNTST